jgi:hypothetical protein
MRKVALALAAAVLLLSAGSFAWKADATMVGTAADFARAAKNYSRPDRLPLRRLLQTGLRDGVPAVRLLVRALRQTLSLEQGGTRRAPASLLEAAARGGLFSCGKKNRLRTENKTCTLSLPHLRLATSR